MDQVLWFFCLCCCCSIFLCCWYVDCLKRSAEQKCNWRLAENEWNKKTAETLFVNTPSEGLTGTHPLLLMLLFLLLFLVLSFLCCYCVDFLKISAKQKWNWRLAENGRNKRTVEVLIVNTPSGDWAALTLYCCLYCYIFCAVAADIV